MNNRDFGLQFEARTKGFAIMIIRLSSSLSNSPENMVIRNQITKSGTSIGANYREANRSRSRADFINKMKICESEANETVYWLEVIADMNNSNAEKVQSTLQEAKEILAILTSIVKTLKTR